MAAALVSCIHDKKIAKSVIASGRNIKNLIDIKKKYKIKTTKNNKKAAKDSDILFICVKPQDIGIVLNEIKSAIKNQLIVSIAAGIRLKQIESVLKNKRVIRVMPNINCLAGEMAAGFCAGRYATNKDVKDVSKILNSAGTSLLLKEKLMDAVTAISGSGPAFFAYFIKAFEEAGIKNGLSKEAACRMAVQTMLGTAKLLKGKSLSAEELIKLVASKKGATKAGLSVFKKYKADEIIIETINAAVKRSMEIGK